MRTRSRRMKRFVPVALVVFLAGTVSPGCVSASAFSHRGEVICVFVGLLGGGMIVEGARLSTSSGEGAAVLGATEIAMGVFCLVSAHRLWPSDKGAHDYPAQEMLALDLADPWPDAGDEAADDGPTFGEAGARLLYSF